MILDKELNSKRSNHYFNTTRLLLLLFVALIFSRSAMAQKTDSLTVFPFDFTRDLQEQIPTLDSLIMLAHLHSPMLGKYESFSKAEKDSYLPSIGLCKC